MVKKKQLFYIFCSFTLLVCGEKNIFPNLTNSPEPGFFGTLEPEPLGEKSGVGAAWKKSQEPEPLKNLPAPQPWKKGKQLWPERDLRLGSKLET